MRVAAVPLYRPAPRRAAAPRVPSPLAGLAARLVAGRLDRRLVAGAESWRSPLHAAHAVRITGARERRSLAAALERLVERSQGPQRPLARSAAIPPDGAQIRDALPLIMELSARLRQGAPLRARGIAALRLLVADGTGPCYAAAVPFALAAELSRIARWLDTEE